MKGVIWFEFGNLSPRSLQIKKELQSRSLQIPGVAQSEWALQSPTILRKAQDLELELYSLEDTIQKMYQNGIREYLMVGLHLLSGSEHHKLAKNLKKIFAKPEYAKCSFHLLPALVCSLSSQKVLTEILVSLQQKVCASQESLVLMAHGHPQGWGDTSLRSIKLSLKYEYSNPIYLAALEGENTLKELLNELQSDGKKSLVLAPLLFSVGKHTRKDLLGSEENTWKSLLEQKGFKCRAYEHGLLEIPEIQQEWLKRLQLR